MVRKRAEILDDIERTENLLKSTERTLACLPPDAVRGTLESLPGELREAISMLRGELSVTED